MSSVGKSEKLMIFLGSANDLKTTKMFYLLGTQTKQHIPQINAAGPCEQGWE